MKKTILMILLSMLLLNVALAADYTENTKTECINGVCSKEIHGGYTYVYEDGQYKHFTEANSLKGTPFTCSIKKGSPTDPDVSCLDFNANRVQLEVKGNKAGDVPVKYYKLVYDEIQKEYLNKEQKAEEKALNFKDDKEVKSQWYDLKLGDKLHLGETSTVVTVTLENNTYENLGDIRYYNMSSAYSGAILKWNISTTLALNVTQVFQCFHWKTVSGSPTGNVTVSRVLNQTWDEGLSLADFNAQSTANSTTLVLNSTVVNTTGCIDVTDQVLSDHALSNDYSSLNIYLTGYQVLTQATHVDDGNGLNFGELETTAFTTNDRENKFNGFDYPTLKVLYLAPQTITVDSFTCSAINNNSLRIAWVASGNFTYATLYNYTGAVETTLYNGTVLNYNHTGLNANTRYNYKLRARYSDVVYTEATVSCSTAASPTVSACTLINQGLYKLVLGMGLIVTILIAGIIISALASMTSQNNNTDFKEITRTLMSITGIVLVLGILVALGINIIAAVC